MAPKRWENLQRFADYAQFERIALGSILVVLSAIALYAIVTLVIKIVGDFMLGESFLDKAALQDTFGAILTILIILEFSHSVYVALTQKSGALQVRTVILITVLVIARKVMLQDFGTASIQTLLGFGALLLVLGVIYWLISNADRPRVNPAPADSNRDRGA